MLKSVLIAAAVAALAPAAALAAAQVGQPAPAFSVKDADGRTRSLSEFKGKTVVLEWTNSGCPYVQKHYTSGNMQKTQAAATGQGVTWLTVVSSAPGKQGYVDGAGAKAWKASSKAASSAVLLDPQGTMGQAYGAKTTPHMYVINGAGTLTYMGGIDDKPTNKVEDVPGAKNYVLAALGDMKAGRPVADAVTRPYGCSVKY